MSGRGNLLSLFHKNIEKIIEAPQSKQEEDFKCKEAATERLGSGGDNKSIDGEQILAGLQNVSIGRGRANLLQSFRNDQQQLGSIQSTPTIKSKPIDNQKAVTKEVVCATKKYGSKGSPVNLSCNYIGLKSDPKKGVYLYEVQFNPNVDSQHMRMKLLNEHRSKFGGTKTFDGSILYLPILLENELTTFVSKSNDDKEIEIRVIFKKKEALKNCIHLYNVLFDRVMKTLNYVRFNRKQFDPTQPKIIPVAKLEVWPGYVTAVDEYDGGLMLCCDVSHRILCQKTVFDILVEIYRQNKADFQDMAKKYLIGSIVLTRYNNRTYRVDNICFSQNPLSEFTTSTGSCSYVDYYKNHHNINIKDTKQPLIVSVKRLRNDEGAKTGDIEFCLIPELCYLTGLQDQVRSDKKLMLEISAATRVTPNQRIQALNKFIRNVSENANAREILENWGLSLLGSYNNIIGRKFDPEQIYFAKQSASSGPNAAFSKAVAVNELLEVVHLNHWLLIHQQNDIRPAKSFLQNMRQCSQTFGMNLAKPKIIMLERDGIEAYANALRGNLQPQIQIVVVICPNSRDDRYAAIKKICCTEIPVASQVINARTLCNETKNRSIVQNIVMQMNSKMGGSLWTVKIPFRNVMICGIDVYHEALQKSNSVAAFVASLDSSYTHWYSKAKIQSKKEELANGLTQCFESALACYKKRNGHLPESVIIYRDGVGDGQLNLCVNYEVPQFERVCGEGIKITFIVVQKRINTRFFMANKNEHVNPLPGTVVDKGITRTKMFDFFLVSQAVNQGTVTPTHFVVVRDDVDFGPDIIQKLSYKLCFLYYNWQGSVKVPACCLYAHKLAFLIGQSVQRETENVLAERLFYL